MRLFIALPLSENLKQMIAEIQKQLNIGMLSFPKPEALHLTLFFLGDFKDSGIKELELELEKVGFGKFILVSSGVGVLGSKNAPRVVYLGLNNSYPLNNLAENIEKTAGKFKIKQDHPFMAHITIARVKRIFSQELVDMQARIETINKIIQPVSFECSKFVLYSSSLTSKGSIYNKLKEFYSD